MNTVQWRRSGSAIGLSALLLVGGCATLTASGPRNASDPWENFNRQVFAFNEVLDRVALKPAAQAYQAVVPEWLRTGVSNVFGNLSDVWSSVNLMFQAKPRAALEMGMRVGTNTLFGVAGFFDAADDLGLPRQGYEDFGQTLGYWGVGSGPYLVLPFFGPSSVRDGGARLLDEGLSGANLVLNRARERNVATALRVLDTRVHLLNAGKVLDGIALDKYTLLRDAYLARRRSLITDDDSPTDSPADVPAAPAATAASAATSASAPASK